MYFWAKWCDLMFYHGIYCCSVFTGTFNFAIVSTCVILFSLRAMSSSVVSRRVASSSLSGSIFPVAAWILVTSLFPACPLQLGFTASLTVFGCLGFGFHFDCKGAVATTSADRSVCLCGQLSRSLVAVDDMIRVPTVLNVSRPSFDDECCAMNWTVHYLQRAASRAEPPDVVTTTAATNEWSVRCLEYRDLLRRKRESFWTLNAPLLVNCGIRSIHWWAVDIYRCLSLLPPSFSAAPLGCVLRAFRPLAVSDVVPAVRLLPDKQCNSDPLPTHLLKVNIGVLAQFLVKLFNRSLTLGVVPTAFKLTYITPLLLKKVDLDPANARSCRPICQ